MKLFFAVLLLGTTSLAAQNSIVSEVDQNLTVRSLGILPCTDNTSGVYCRYVETKLKNLISDGHRFSLVDLKEVDPRLTTDDYAKAPATVRTIGQKNLAEGLIIAQVTKVDKTISIRMDLFLASDGLLLASEQIDNETRFEVSDVEKKVAELYGRLIGKLPYKGLVLSRQGQRVTIDMGSLDGIKENTVMTVDQIISIKRHPKFNFVLSSEKEVMGRIKIVKAEPKLSFAIVLQEKEKGVIGKNSKLSGIDFVNYADTTAHGAPEAPLKDSSFGKSPREWNADKQPVLGYVGLAIGVGNFHDSITYQTAGNIMGDNSFYPQIDLRGEIWLTRNWAVGGGLRQGIFSMGNTLAGSTPGNLNANQGHYNLQVSYKFLLQDEFWGPQIAASLGFSRYDMFVDRASPPSLNSTSYSGLYIGVAGHVPLDEEKIYVFDVELNRVLFPVMTESPATDTSGASSDNSITTIGIGGSYKMNTNFRIKAMLNFEFYSSNFSGMGARGDQGLSSSQSLTTLLGGLDYYF